MLHRYARSYHKISSFINANPKIEDLEAFGPLTVRRCSLLHDQSDNIQPYNTCWSLWA